MVDDKDRVVHFLAEILHRTTGMSKPKAQNIASRFDSLEGFTKAPRTDFEEIFKSKRGNVPSRAQKHLDGIMAVQAKIEPDKDLIENWIKFTSRNMTGKILENIEKLSLDKININPFLTKMLHFRTPEELLRFNVYQTISRSIVTSMGTALEYMVADCGGKSSRRGRKGEWYDVVKTKGKNTYWFQIKSGPNNIDKDQMRAFSRKFNKTAKKHNQHPRLGIVYGKPDVETISIGMAKKYLDGHESRVLIGRDLWEFMSGEVGYHNKVLRWIEEAVEGELRKKSIDDMIQVKIKEITAEFKKKYGNSIDRYIKDIL